MRRTAEWRTATATAALAAGTPTSGSALFCPQVNREPAGGRRWSVAVVAVESLGCGRRLKWKVKWLSQILQIE